MVKLGFIGIGNMATAIISGISRSELDVQIYGYDADSSKADSLSEYGFLAASDIQDLCNRVEYLLIAVKPQNFTDVLMEIKPFISANIVIISIAAGISSEFVRSKLEFDVKFVRAMPNTPLMLSLGATALCKSDNVSSFEFEFAQQIFNCAGITKMVSEDKMNEIIAINGSSPAFIYEYARCFVEYGVSVGLNEQDCLVLFAHTIIGSAEMLLSSGKSIDSLISMVSSKGGTTIAGLESLRENDLQNCVKKACERCVNRAYELESELTNA